jgi:hypothetical protein
MLCYVFVTTQPDSLLVFGKEGILIEFKVLDTDSLESTVSIL